MLHSFVLLLDLSQGFWPLLSTPHISLNLEVLVQHLDLQEHFEEILLREGPDKVK